MVQVRWTFQAIFDLEGIHDYVARERPVAARRLAARLRSAAESLDQTPERGRSVGGGRRELTTVTPYLISYRLALDYVEIVTIRHGARRSV